MFPGFMRALQDFDQEAEQEEEEEEEEEGREQGTSKQDQGEQARMLISMQVRKTRKKGKFHAIECLACKLELPLLPVTESA